MLASSVTNTSHILDHPVQAAFQSHWRPVARRTGSAWMLPSDIGPFAAQGGHSQEDQSDFSRMLSERGAPVIVLQKDDVTVPDNTEVLAHEEGVQMVYGGGVVENDDFGHVKLNEQDAVDMHALAHLTAPGPFAERTHVLGEFIGIKKDGQLIAMAGQRMQTPGWTEISAVCVHPDSRGQGLATKLIKAMCGIIQSSGQVPFLHTYASNVGAIALYEKLGFRLRTRVHVASLAHR